MSQNIAWDVANSCSLGRGCGRGAGAFCAASIQEIEEAAQRWAGCRVANWVAQAERSRCWSAPQTGPPEAVEAGILCGINFWHKADEWEPGNVPAGHPQESRGALLPGLRGPGAGKPRNGSVSTRKRTINL